MKIIDNEEPLVDMEDYGLMIHPIYHEWGFSNNTKCLLRKTVAEKVAAAEKKLPTGMRFKLWDGYRLIALQRVLYDDLYKKIEQDQPDWDEQRIDEAVREFVAFPSYDPLFPSNHNTGGSIDLTIIDNEGKELPMGTPFDEFTVKSHSSYFAKENNEFHRNRMLLREVMMAEGFSPYVSEWWHFDYGNQNWANYYGKSHAIYGSVELASN